MKRNVINVVRHLTVVMAAIVTVVFLSSCAKDEVDVKEQIHVKVDKIEQAIDHFASSAISASSSLYDEVKSNEDFIAIIALGFAALPELMQLLEQSEQDGSKEYIYAVALEQLSKVEMRKEADWKTGKEFLDAYRVYLQEIPSKVTSIVNEPISDTEKIDQLKLLGTPAIPYLFDVVRSELPQLSPAFDYLTDNESKGDLRKWSIEHVDQLNLLINFVEQS